MAYECMFRCDMPWGPKGTKRLYEEAEFDQDAYFVYPDGMHNQGFPIPKATFEDFFEPITKQFVPEVGKTFYYLSPSLTPSRAEWSGSGYQRQIHASGNCFRKLDDAKEAAKRVREVLIRLHESLYKQV